MLEKIRNYIDDKEFSFTVYENKIYLVNFKRIILLEDNCVSLVSYHKKIMICGNKLTLNKLLEKEMLITGDITKIEVTNV